MSDTEAAADAMRAFALALPGAHEDFPWGERAYKVDGKVFVFCGSAERLTESLGFSVKLKQTAVDALEEPAASPTGYGLGRHGWVSFTYPIGVVPQHTLLLARIEESYRSVAKKRRIKELDSR
ncbi:MAG: putative DNA-binding protein (MmcQ/YjbR family) [Myxococcota bacterium]|jgi:predicted DNA-binding protein (MmcQ/YjbR family)